MRILFYKHDFAWPRASGHDVHTYHMMREMSRLGARIGLVSRSRPPEAALAGIAFDVQEVLNESAGADPDTTSLSLSPLEERFRCTWGVRRAHIARVGAIAEDFRADAVVVSGLDVLPLLGAVKDATRVWYAADEWFWHHVSQASLSEPASWRELREALVKGLYERAYRKRLDRVWVVSDADATAMKWVAGVSRIDVLPNGVDCEWYRPSGDPGAPDTAVFWGRLDFGPNIQALQWFCRKAWPVIRQRRPTATFTIMGFSPGDAVNQLAAIPGVVVQADVPDIRTEVSRHAVVVLPFVSGGGIKNKLLEAAAMGRPVVCSTRVLHGLTGEPPLLHAGTPADWARVLIELWSDEAARMENGRRLRAWVEVHHTWNAVATRALHALDVSPRHVPLAAKMDVAPLPDSRRS